MTDSIIAQPADEDQEIWKDVPGYPGYQVSNFGNVKSYSNYGHKGISKFNDLPHMLRPSIVRGRRVVVLFNEFGKKQFKIYRLVLLAFIGPCPPEMQACHYNGNSFDDKLTNLRWGTSLENKKDNYRLGVEGFGEKAGRSKLTNCQAKSIKNEYHNGVPAKILMNKYGLCKTAIYRIIKGKTYPEIDHPLYEQTSFADNPV